MEQWDHPRLRGEQRSRAQRGGMMQGSPPLARGTAGKAPREKQSRGITPACAGNRLYSYSRSPSHRDHPRLRGEQLTGSFTILSLKGSPPLARGTAKSDCQEIKAFRITPACAGNSTASAVIATANRDHPRLRGEQALNIGVGSVDKGSPPLARGTVIRCSASSQGTGITPACAGNSYKNESS